MNNSWNSIFKRGDYLKFQVLNRAPKNREEGIYLVNDDWNDWGFQTTFHLYIIDNNSRKHHIGEVKIGDELKKNASTQEVVITNLPETFEGLTSNFFSLGQSIDYYRNLDKLSNKYKEAVLNDLKDIAADLNLFEKVKEYEVTKYSLLRGFKSLTVRDQFHRITKGEAILTNYSFSYSYPNENNENMKLDFNVVPDSWPPSNVHALIGSNGVGKTTLINNMVDFLIEPNSEKNGYFESNASPKTKDLFANVVFVSFSAFDNAEHILDNDNEDGIALYSYVGLKELEDNSLENNQHSQQNIGSKTPQVLAKEFHKSLYSIANYLDKRKYKLWQQSIEKLGTDPVFDEYNLKNIIQSVVHSDNSNESMVDEMMDEYKKNEVTSFFLNNLSSGHKIILLTITKLIEKVDEKTLVVFDEPEAHLHPPLLSAFIRVLSDILTSSNGVGILATHSPVILQEIPKNCVWKLRRHGNLNLAERPETETFGENIGTLTKEVFGLEVTESGFYSLIKQSVKKNQEYENVINSFNDRLGTEARFLIRSLLLNKK